MLAVVDEMVERQPQVAPVAGSNDDGFDGIRLAAVPVGVEDVAQSLHRAADDQHVHIDEVARRAASEVLVRDIAPAHHCDDAVGDEQLVVHPVIEALERRERRDVLRGDALPPAAERIEKTHLHVLEGREAAKHLVAADRVEVIHEQTHAHAAQGRVAQAAHEQPPGSIVGDEVVLDIERVHGTARKLDSGVER